MMTSKTTSSPTSEFAPEIVYVKERQISCNGDGGALGHPMVYYTLKDGEAECGYCDRKFIYDPAKAS